MPSNNDLNLQVQPVAFDKQSTTHVSQTPFPGCSGNAGKVRSGPSLLRCLWHLNYQTTSDPRQALSSSPSYSSDRFASCGAAERIPLPGDHINSPLTPHSFAGSNLRHPLMMTVPSQLHCCRLLPPGQCPAGGAHHYTECHNHDRISSNHRMRTHDHPLQRPWVWTGIHIPGYHHWGRRDG